MAAKSKAEMPDRQLRLARAIATLISIVLIGLGIWSMASQTYAGHTSKLGGADIFLSGSSAVRAGATHMALGLLPLALWFKTPAHAAWWASFCITAFLGLLAASLYG